MSDLPNAHLSPAGSTWFGLLAVGECGRQTGVFSGSSLHRAGRSVTIACRVMLAFHLSDRKYTVGGTEDGFPWDVRCCVSPLLFVLPCCGKRCSHTLVRRGAAAQVSPSRVPSSLLLVGVVSQIYVEVIAALLIGIGGTVLGSAQLTPLKLVDQPVSR